MITIFSIDIYTYLKYENEFDWQRYTCLCLYLPLFSVSMNNKCISAHIGAATAGQKIWKYCRFSECVP